MESEDKFIGFVDVLGFSQLVEAAENGTGMKLPELMDVLKHLGSSSDVEKAGKYGPATCPQSKYLQKDLNFQLTQVSDCVIVSSEISPAGAINLISHCWGAVINLLTKGIMCRGYITRGSVYHSQTSPYFIGSGYQQACFKEKNGITAFKRQADERGTPFVEVGPVICDYVKNCGDKCVKEMFSRMVKSDGNVTALFPFKRLAHSFMIGGFGRKFEPQKEKDSNDNWRSSIGEFKKRIMEYVDGSNPDAVKKAEHYIEALNAQLEVCDKTDEMIDKLNSPFPSRKL